MKEAILSSFFEQDVNLSFSNLFPKLAALVLPVYIFIHFLKYTYKTFRLLSGLMCPLYFSLMSVACRHIVSHLMCRFPLLSPSLILLLSWSCQLLWRQCLLDAKSWSSFQWLCRNLRDFPNQCNLTNLPSSLQGYWEHLHEWIRVVGLQVKFWVGKFRLIHTKLLWVWRQVKARVFA